MAKAAKTNSPNTMPRRHFLSCRYLTTPTRLSITTSSGSSKLIPKMISSDSMNEMYLSAVSAVMNSSCPKPMSSCRAWGKSR